jgi:hypothetical protein
MRTTRIVLAISPLILLLPNLGNQMAYSSAGGMMAAFFYGRLLSFFPWNVLLACLAYFYARHRRGQEAFWWGLGAMGAPFVVPLVLACMPERWDSTAAVMRRTTAAPATTEGAPVKGPIEERLPLLARCLASAPEEIRAEQKSRFARVAANLEFSLCVDKGTAERIPAEAASRDFNVWMSAGEGATHVYGAGRVPLARRDAIVDWLHKASAPGQVLRVSFRDAEGIVGMTEYHKAG